MMFSLIFARKDIKAQITKFYNKKKEKYCLFTLINGLNFICWNPINLIVTFSVYAEHTLKILRPQGKFGSDSTGNR